MWSCMQPRPPGPAVAGPGWVIPEAYFNRRHWGTWDWEGQPPTNQSINQRVAQKTQAPWVDPAPPPCDKNKPLVPGRRNTNLRLEELCPRRSRRSRGKEFCASSESSRFIVQPPSTVPVPGNRSCARQPPARALALSWPTGTTGDRPLGGETSWGYLGRPGYLGMRSYNLPWYWYTLLYYARPNAIRATLCDVPTLSSWSLARYTAHCALTRLGNWVSYSLFNEINRLSLDSTPVSLKSRLSFFFSCVAFESQSRRRHTILCLYHPTHRMRDRREGFGNFI